MAEFINKIAEIDSQREKAQIEKSLLLEKALNSGNVDEIYKARKYYEEISSKKNNGSFGSQKSLLIDPLESSSGRGYYDKRSSAGFPLLRQMSSAPVIRAVLNTRKEQISEYTKPQPDKYSKGFILRPTKLSTGNDDKLGMSDLDKKNIEELTRFILNCGNEERAWGSDDFEVFIRKIVEDSLVLDQAVFEVVGSRGDIMKPNHYFAVDSSMFRFADSFGNEGNLDNAVKIAGHYPSYVQVYQNNIVSEFYPWQLCFGVRNVSTDIRRNNYGRSELEDLMGTVTSMLNGDAYNANFFKSGSSPKGALLIKGGGLNETRLQEFKKEWNAETAGVNNSHKTPIIDAEKMEWLDLQLTNRDMEFSKFQEYLIKIACAVYKISPEEIGFPLEGSGKYTLGRTNKKEEKDYSTKKGLIPLLRTIQSWLNKYIVGPKSKGAYELIFVGLDPENADEESNRLNKAITTYMTVNEVRVQKGLPPLKGGIGDIILNPIYSQQYLSEGGVSEEEEQKVKREVVRDSGLPDSKNNNDVNPMVKAVEDFWIDEMIVKP